MNWHKLQELIQKMTEEQKAMPVTVVICLESNNYKKVEPTDLKFAQWGDMDLEDNAPFIE